MESRVVTRSQGEAPSTWRKCRSLRAFLDAIIAEQPLPLFYQGGSTPGALRRFTPTSIHRLRPGGPIYARGHCHLRDAPRTLRLDRVRLA